MATESFYTESGNSPPNRTDLAIADLERMRLNILEDFPGVESLEDFKTYYRDCRKEIEALKSTKAALEACDRMIKRAGCAKARGTTAFAETHFDHQFSHVLTQRIEEVQS